MRHESQKKQAGNDPKKIPGGIQDEDSDEIILENILVDIVGQNIADKMPKNDPEYKNFKENYDRILAYFVERFKYISDELVLEIFEELNNRLEEIVNVLSRNMLDFCDLIQFFAQAMQQVNPTVSVAQDDELNSSKQTNIFDLMHATLSKIAIKLLNLDPQ